MPTTRIDLSKLAETLKREINGVEQKLHEAALETALFGQQLIVTQIIPNALPHAPVDTRFYARAWKAIKTAVGASLRNDAPYAGVIERGRRPGRMPPVDVILQWVLHKGFVGRRGSRADREKAARGIAFVIARSIGKKGSPPKHILASALPEIRRHLGVTIKAKLKLR